MAVGADFCWERWREYWSGVVRQISREFMLVRLGEVGESIDRILMGGVDSVSEDQVLRMLFPIGVVCDLFEKECLRRGKAPSGSGRFSFF